VVGSGLRAPHGAGLLFFTVVPIVATLVISFFNWPLLGTPLVLGRHRQLCEDPHRPDLRRVVLNTLLFVVSTWPLTWSSRGWRRG